MSNVLVIGSGSRENVICEKLSFSSYVSKIWALPGNDGMQNVEFIRDINEYNYYDILTRCLNYSINFVIIGSETHLVGGLVDVLESNNIICFGPNKRLAKMTEGSKISSKILMQRYNIPTSEFASFDLEFQKEKAISYFVEKGFENCVIKQDGLAGGKGVYLPDSNKKGINIIRNLDCNILIEKRLFGTEVSVMGFCNGKEFMPMPQTQDFKRIGDGDIGLNTGGMGAICPVDILNENEMKQLKSSLDILVKDLNYKGVLYAGVMKTDDGFYVLEFNCRFGDPEAQVLLNKLETDFFDVCYKCSKGLNVNINWNNDFVANVVSSHITYPVSKSYEPLDVIIHKNFDEENLNLYWGNIKNEYGVNYTKGGRVCSVVANNSYSLFNALSTIYNNINYLMYREQYYRTDIGLKYLLNNRIQKNKKLKIGVIGDLKINSNIEFLITNSNINFDKNNKTNILCLPNFDEKIIINYIQNTEVDIIFCNVRLSELVIDTIGNRLIMVESNFNYYNENKMNILSNNECILMRSRLNFSELIDNFLELCRNGNYTFIHSYSNSGVDIDKGNQFVELIKGLPSKNKDKIGGFCSIVPINNEMSLGLATDGVGTKIELAREYDKLDTIGIDLVAMSVNDLLARGVTPKYFLDYLAVNKIDLRKNYEIIKGIHRGCEIAGCELVGGETAEMGSVYKMDGFDLAGFAIGYINNENILPRNVKSGDKIYGLLSNGIHSNGYSLVRKIMKQSDYDINELLKPTKIYTKEVFDLLEKYGDRIKGFAHITGGGLYENIKRIIPKELSFELNLDNWELPEIFKWLKEKGYLDEKELYKTFNCGIGMAVITDGEIENELLIGKIN